MSLAADEVASGASVLKRAGIELPLFEAQLLMALASGNSRLGVLTALDRALTPEDTDRMRALIAERARRVPLAYLRGTQEFYGLEFEVSPHVLIPRPETEILVDVALESLDLCSESLVVDVGTGSGCIPITVGAKRPAARLLATDIDSRTLEVARRNAMRHGASSRVAFVQGDLLAPLRDQCAGIIVANLPYVCREDLAGLQSEVCDHEPHSALDGGIDGLDHIRRLIPHVVRVLRPGGLLGLEVGLGQAESVGGMLETAGFTSVDTRRDLAGIDRVVTGILSC